MLFVSLCCVGSGWLRLGASTVDGVAVCVRAGAGDGLWLGFKCKRLPGAVVGTFTDGVAGGVMPCVSSLAVDECGNSKFLTEAKAIDATAAVASAIAANFMGALLAAGTASPACVVFSDDGPCVLS